MLKRSVTILLAISTAAAADTAYVVRASEGVFLSEFTNQPDACDPETRAELGGILHGLPVLTIGESMVLTTAKVDSTSRTFSAGVDAVGTWTFGSKILTVSVRHWGRGDHGPKVIDVEVSRVRRGRACRELWSGIVLPTRTREVLRGR